MTDQPASGSAAGEPGNGAPDALPQAQTQVPASHGTNTPSASNSFSNETENQYLRTSRIFGRLRTNEWLTFFVGLCSLVVSILTYRNAADTSDLQRAVSNLATLASESHRQADAAQGQLTLAQKSNRPFVFLRLKSMFFHAQSGRAGDEFHSIISQFNFTNYGTGPAIISQVNYGIFFNERGSLETHSTLAGTPLPNGDSTQDFFAAQQFKPGEEVDFNAGKIAIILRGNIVYADISDRPGKTWFCYQFAPKSFAEGQQPIPVELSADCTNKHE